LYAGDERVRGNDQFAVRINGPQTDLAKDDIRSLFNVSKALKLLAGLVGIDQP